jgi:hypothetical protein
MTKPRWTHVGLPLAAVGLGLLLFACSDIPLGPGDAPPPARAIQDALHGEGGNPFVFLKPPVVDQPPAGAFGTFDPDLQPIVEICEAGHIDADTGLCGQLLLTNDGTATPARYTVSGGPGGESVRVSTVDEEYQVQLHFSLFDLEAAGYRILTRVGSLVLAYADVIIVSPREMKNADSDNNIVFTNDSRTLPWKVRIDQGALCWDPGNTVTTCESATVTAGEETTITLTSSDGEEVVLYFPDGWSAEVDGETQEQLTLTIEEVPAIHGTPEDPSCFANFLLSDPTTGEPENCYDVRADTDTQTDVSVVFGGALPVLAFCPEPAVLQAIVDAGGTSASSYIMTSVEDDTQGAVRRTYDHASAGIQCNLPPAQISFGDGPVGQFATGVWKRLRPAVEPLLPAPLYAIDLGFGGELAALSTIFFWARTPEAIAVTPASANVAVGQTVQLSADPVYHHGENVGGGVAVAWTSANPAVASVDVNGTVTGNAQGVTEIIATATDVLGSDGTFLTASSTITVTTAVTASVSGSVLDASLQPIPGATVVVQGIAMGALTNAQGYYSLSSVPAGSVTLEVSMVGFSAQVSTFTATGGQSYVKNFVLQTTGPLTLDQYNDTDEGSTASNQGGSLWQSFTPTASSIAAVRLRLRAGGSFPAGGHTSEVRIRAGSPAGQLLGTATESVPGPQATGSTVEVTHTFTTALALTPGDTYVIEWVSPDPAILTWFFSTQNPYAGGSSLLDSGAEITGRDYVFRTYY